MRVTAMLICQEIRQPRDFDRKGTDLLQVAPVLTVSPLPAPLKRLLYIEGHRTEPDELSAGVLEVQKPDGSFYHPWDLAWNWDGQGEKVGRPSSFGHRIDLSGYVVDQPGNYTFRFRDSKGELLMGYLYTILSPTHRINVEQGQHSPPVSDEGIHEMDDQGRTIMRPDPDA